MPFAAHASQLGHPLPATTLQTDCDLSVLVAGASAGVIRDASAATPVRPAAAPLENPRRPLTSEGSVSQSVSGETRTRTGDTTIFSRAALRVQGPHLQGLLVFLRRSARPDFPALCVHFPGEKADGGGRLPFHGSRRHVPSGFPERSRPDEERRVQSAGRGRGGAAKRPGSLRRRERRESDGAGAACGAGGGGGTRRAEVRDRDRRAGRRGLAAAGEGCRVAAGPGGLSRGGGDGEPGEDLDRDALLSGVGTSKGPEAERDGVCRAHPRPAAAAVLQDRRSRDRAGSTERTGSRPSCPSASGRGWPSARAVRRGWW